MIDVATLFSIISVIIAVGYLSSRFFEKTKIPDTIILMCLGLLIGPILNIVGSDLIGASKAVMPFFAAMAMMLLLFGGGLHINFFRVIKSFKNAVFFTLFVFVLTVALITGLAMLAFGWNLLNASLLAVIIGGTSSAVIIPLIHKTSASDETKMMIDLESSITDALCVIIALAIAGIITANQLDIAIVGQNVLGAFSISAVVAFVVALGWLSIRNKLPEGKYEYLVTIAVLFGLYSAMEYFKANGAIAALVFGIVLGNAKEITAMLKLAPKDIDWKVTLFHEEISFFVKTVFFVYLGIVFELSAFKLDLIIFSIVTMVLIIGARFAGAKLMARNSETARKDTPIIVSMMSRGLAAAVLASVPLTLGIGDVAGQIFSITFIIILLSDIFTSAGTFISERRAAEEKNDARAGLPRKEINNKNEKKKSKPDAKKHKGNKK